MERLTQLWIISALLAVVATLGTLLIAQSIAESELDKQAKAKAIAAAQRPSIEIVP